MTAPGPAERRGAPAAADPRAGSLAAAGPTAPPAPAAELERRRDEIERIDRALVGLIAERVQHARAIGVAKRAAGLPTLDPAREAAVVRRAAGHARDARLDAEDVRSIFWSLIDLCRRAQQSEAAS